MDEEANLLNHTNKRIKDTLPMHDEPVIAQMLLDINATGSADKTVSYASPGSEVSYRDKLLNVHNRTLASHIIEYFHDFNIDPEIDNPGDGITFIPITTEDKQRMYKPWIHSLIIKVFGKKVGYRLLLSRLNSLWQIYEEIKLIDLGFDYFLMRFTQPEIILEFLWKARGLLENMSLLLDLGNPSLTLLLLSATLLPYGFDYQAYPLNFMTKSF